MNINATLFVEVIIFLSFIWLTFRFVWPHVNAVIEERQHMINEGIKQAEESKNHLASAKKDAKKILDEAKDSTREVMLHTEERVRQILDQAHVQGEQERQKIVDRAQADIDQSEKLVYEELLKHISGLTIKATKAVLRDTVDVKVDEKIVTNLIKEERGE